MIEGEGGSNILENLTDEQIGRIQRSISDF